MPHDDVRLIDGVYEMFDGDRQLTVGGDAIVFTNEDAEALREALCEETSFGEKYVFNAANFTILTHVCTKLNRHKPLPAAITKRRIFEAYTIVDQAGGMTEYGNLQRVPEEVAAPTPPRAADGRFADAHQLLREEVRRLINDPTVSNQAIRERANKDRAFGDAFRAELAPAAPARDEVDEGQRALDVAHYGAFVRAFRYEPNPRFLNGRITIGGVEYTKEEFDKHMTEVGRLGL